MEDSQSPAQPRPTTPEDLHRLAALAHERGLRLTQETRRRLVLLQRQSARRPALRHRPELRLSRLHGAPTLHPSTRCCSITWAGCPRSRAHLSRRHPRSPWFPAGTAPVAVWST